MTSLVLIVGFLGSGKTTLMRELVPMLTERGLRPHVILNDFQNAGVDASYFAGLAETVAPINGSCVCCESFEDLIGALEDQNLSEPSILLLEANGTTDSVELIEQLSLRPECARYTMPIQISVVDAKRWQDRFWHNALEREQVATARYLRVTWQDAVSAERLAGVRHWLGECAPRAEMVEVEALAAALVATQQEVAAWPLRRLSARHGVEATAHEHDTHDHGHGADHHHEHSRYHFASWECPLPHEVDPRVFYRVLNDLPAEVLRCKGIVRLADQQGRRLIFQKVGDGDLLASHLNAAVDIEPMIIFIGASLPIDQLRARMQRLEAAAAPPSITSSPS